MFGSYGNVLRTTSSYPADKNFPVISRGRLSFPVLLVSEGDTVGQKVRILLARLLCLPQKRSFTFPVHHKES
jgi:hypothetical protein